MFCSKCGAELRAGALFCDKCGASVSGATNPGQAPQKRSSAAIIILAVVLALVIAACGIGAFIFLSGNSEADKSEKIIDIWYKLNNDSAKDDRKARLEFVSTKSDLKPGKGASDEVTEKYTELVDRADNENWNTDTGFFVFVQDDADLLASNEEVALKQAMIPLTKYGNAAFITTDDNSSQTPKFAQRQYRELMDDDSGVLFVIDMDNREIYLFMDGKIHKEIDNDGAMMITDKTYGYASDGYYFRCAEETFDLFLDELED